MSGTDEKVAERIERLARAIEVLTDLMREDWTRASRLLGELRLLVRELLGDVDDLKRNTLVALSRQIEELSRDSMDVARELTREQIDQLRKEKFIAEQERKKREQEQYDDGTSGVRLDPRGATLRLERKHIKYIWIYGRYILLPGAGAGIWHFVQRVLGH